jgi:hypothetical protein
VEFVEWNRYFRGRSRLDALVARASAANRKPIFMIGSGLSLPEEPGGPGVPGTAYMVELVRKQVSDDQAALDDLSRHLERAEQDNASVYGAAFAFLRDWRGPDAANQVILDAVRMARLPEARQSDDAQALESDLEGWALTRGTSALGFLLAGHRQSYPGPVLTTNFDPLLSVAISRAHGHPRRAILDGDGRLPSAAELGPDVTPVIHLHGYWWGSDTHHTGMELSASRPQLGASLARLLNDRLVVVVGYGGWDDAFMQAVSSLLDDTGARPDIAWALYDDDPGMIFTRHAPLLDRFERWRFRSRFTLYVGIDANRFFQKLLDRAIGSIGPVDPDGRLSAPPLADRLHESASLFDGFVRECAAERRVPGDRRARLLAQLVDLRQALQPLSDAELETWHDTEFVVLIRAPRNRAREQMARLRQALSRGEDSRAELRQLVATLTRVRDLIRAWVPATAARPAH